MDSLELATRGARRLGAQEAAALRAAARTAFLHEPASPSLAALGRRPELQRAGLARLLAWACEEDWESQRALGRERRRQRAEEDAQRAYRRAHARRLRQLDDLQEEAARWRSHPRLRPRSWESVAAVQLRAAQLVQGLQAAPPAEHKAARGAAPEERVLTPRDLGLGVVGGKEMQSAAHHILRERRATREQGPPLAVAKET